MRDLFVPGSRLNGFPLLSASAIFSRIVMFGRSPLPGAGRRGRCGDLRPDHKKEDVCFPIPLGAWRAACTRSSRISLEIGVSVNLRMLLLVRILFMTSFIEMFLLSKSECKKFRETYTDLFYHISRQNSRDLKRKLKEKIEIINKIKYQFRFFLSHFHYW